MGDAAGEHDLPAGEGTGQVELVGCEDHGAILGGGGPVTSVNGIATFDSLAVDKVGTAYQLTATATGLTPDPVSDPFDVLQPGIVTSRDGGATWSDPVKLTASYTLSGVNYTFTPGSVTDLKVDPGNSQVVLLTTDQGFFRSTDAGKTFTHIHLTGPSGEPYYYMWSLAYAGPQTWLATGEKSDLTGATAGGGLGLWRSTDDGATWTWNGTGLPGGNAEASAAGRGTLASALSTVQDVSASYMVSTPAGELKAPLDAAAARVGPTDAILDQNDAVVPVKPIEC